MLSCFITTTTSRCAFFSQSDAACPASSWRQVLPSFSSQLFPLTSLLPPDFHLSRDSLLSSCMPSQHIVTLSYKTGAIEDFQPRFPSGDTEWAEEINMNRQDQMLRSRSSSHSCCWIIELICPQGGIDCGWWFGVFSLLRYILFVGMVRGRRWGMRGKPGGE